MSRTTLLVAFLLLPLGAGCAEGGGLPDSGSGNQDAAPRVDAFVPTTDAGPDAGPVTPDAGPNDAGGDSGATDGGPTDAGGLDAGPVDAGPTDAGPVDAGPPDAGPTCTESPCRLAPTQCGCPAGQGCYPTASGRECATAGATGEGGSCTTAADCGAGMICAGSVCSRICLGDADCPGRGSECVYTVAVGVNTLRVCSAPCEPATGAGCPSGMACRYLGSDGSGYYTDCLPAGSTPPDGECGSTSECTSNHTCVTVFLDSYCAQTCRLGGADCGFCSSFFDGSPTIEGQEYGFCP